MESNATASTAEYKADDNLHDHLHDHLRMQIVDVIALPGKRRSPRREAPDWVDDGYAGDMGDMAAAVVGTDRDVIVIGSTADTPSRRVALRVTDWGGPYVFFGPYANDAGVSRLSRRLEKFDRHGVGSISVRPFRGYSFFGYVPSDDDPTVRKLQTFAKVTCQTKPILWDVIRNGGCGQAHEPLNIASVEHKFLLDIGAHYGSWIRVPERALQVPDHALTDCYGQEYACRRGDVSVDRDCNDVAAMRVVVFDIEVLCTEVDDLGNLKFCNAKRPGDQIISIGAVVDEAGVASRRTCFCLGETAPDPSGRVDIVVCQTERELLQRFCHYVRSTDSMGLVSYNGIGFDLKYMYERACEPHVGAIDALQSLHVFRDSGECTNWHPHGPHLRVRKKGNATFISMSGRFHIDCCKWYRDSLLRLERYTLDSVAKARLGADKGKIPMPYAEIPDTYRSGPEGRLRIALYCADGEVDGTGTGAGDIELTRLLFGREGMMGRFVADSIIFFTPVDRLANGGTQQRVVNSQLHYCRRNCTPPFIMSIDDDVQQEKYVGAYVFEPKKGWYGPKDPVLIYDFASLYPSIMMALSLCFTTYIKPGDARSVVNVQGERARFAKCGDSGVLPGLLSLQKRQRTAYKRLKKRWSTLKAEAESAVDYDPVAMVTAVEAAIEGASVIVSKFATKAAAVAYCSQMADNYENMQQSTKVCMNAQYGNSALWLWPLAGFITETGRNVIQATGRAATPFFQERGIEAALVYGDTDSIMVRFPAANPDGGEPSGEELAEHRARVEAASVPFCEMIYRDHNGLVLEFEPAEDWLCQGCCFLDKKRYVGRRLNGTLLIKGLEIKRRGLPPFVRTTLVRFFETIFDDPGRTARLLVERMLELSQPLDREAFVVSRAIQEDYDCYGKSRSASAMLYDEGMTFPAFLGAVEGARSVPMKRVRLSSSDETVCHHDGSTLVLRESREKKVQGKFVVRREWPNGDATTYIDIQPTSLWQEKIARELMAKGQPLLDGDRLSALQVIRPRDSPKKIHSYETLQEAAEKAHTGDPRPLFDLIESATEGILGYAPIDRDAYATFKRDMASARVRMNEFVSARRCDLTGQARLIDMRDGEGTDGGRGDGEIKHEADGGPGDGEIKHETDGGRGDGETKSVRKRVRVSAPAPNSAPRERRQKTLF